MTSERSSLKKVLEIDFSEPKTIETFKFLEASLQPDENISLETINSKQNQLFILKTKQILEHYKPLYEKTNALYKVSYDLGNSLEKIEQFYNELKFRDQLVLNKIKTYKVKETEIQTKKRVLENLIKDSHLSQSNFEILINENTLIDEEFFKALESLDKLHSLQESLGQLPLEKAGLKLSLEKNIAEIRHLALSKLVKHLNRNMEKIEIPLIMKSISLLRNQSDLYNKFLKNYLKFRKNLNTNLMDSILNNNQMIYEREYENYFKEVFDGFVRLLKEEINFLQGIFGEDFKKASFMEAIFEEIIFQIYTRTEKLLSVDIDFSTIFQIYTVLLKNAKIVKQLLYEIPSESLNESKEIEKSHILTSLKNLKKQTETSVKKSLVTFGNKLLSTKFNIQNFASYTILIDFLKRVKNVFDYQVESDNFNNKPPVFSLELMTKPVIDLAQSKVSEYNRATQPLIFAVNVYSLVVGIFRDYETIKEKCDKLLALSSDFKKTIVENLSIEFSKKVGFENLNEGGNKKKNELEEKKVFKMMVEFCVNLMRDENYKLIGKDTELFLEESWKHSVREEMITRFLERYQEILKEISVFCEKNKVEIDSENKISKESLNLIFESNFFQEAVKMYSFDEMKSFMNVLI